MMIEYQHEPICVGEAAIAAFSQAYTEADIIVPDIKPDIAKVLQVDSNAIILSKRCAADKVILDGNVRISILYIGEDTSVKSVNTIQAFSHSVDAKGAVEGMEIELETDVENVEFEIINSRRVKVRTLVGIDVRVVMRLDAKLITYVSGGEFETLMKSIKPYSVVTRIDEDISVKERLEIPAGKPGISSVLKMEGRVKGTELKVAANKLIIRGSLCITTLYIGDMDESIIQFMEHEVPFTEIIDAMGTDEGMTADVIFSINEISYDIEEDSDGDSRLMVADVKMRVTGKVSKQCEMDIIEDIYSTKAHLCVAKGTTMIDAMAADLKTSVTLNDTAVLPDDLPEVVQVYNVISKPYISGTRTENGKIVVEGIIDAYILYLSDDNQVPIHTHKHEHRFCQYIDAEGVTDDMYCDVKLDVEHTGFNIGLGREIQLRFILGIGIKVISTEKIEYVSDITVSESLPETEKPKCCIKIYFVQRGDRLWDIAKKYQTTVDKIMCMNDLSEGTELMTGKQIIIP